jgi:hypothetical protein
MSRPHEHANWSMCVERRALEAPPTATTLGCSPRTVASSVEPEYGLLAM